MRKLPTEWPNSVSDYLRRLSNFRQSERFYNLGPAPCDSTLPRQRFGVILLPYNVKFQTMRAAAKKAEDLGFDSVWVPDHLQRGELPTLECWTTLSALSASTDRIRLGSLATCNQFRNPALLAKMVSTVSQISAGRVDLGIGAGYDEAEHAAYGYPFLDFRGRVSQLSEALAVITSLWSGNAVTLSGRHYKVKDAVCLPAPEQKPRIWVAGRNERVFEAAASNHAYGVNILPYSGTLENRKISSEKELDEISEKISTYRSLKKSMYCGDGGAVVGQTSGDFSKRISAASRHLGLSVAEPERRLQNLSAVYGTVEQVGERLRSLASMGFEECMLIFHGWQNGDFTDMECFAEAFLT